MVQGWASEKLEQTQEDPKGRKNLLQEEQLHRSRPTGPRFLCEPRAAHEVRRERVAQILEEREPNPQRQEEEKRSSICVPQDSGPVQPE